MKTEHTAQQLAKMAFNAKAAVSNKMNPQDPDALMPPVFAAHKTYLRAVAKGAEVPASDLDFVNAHLKELRKQFPGQA